MVYLTMVDEAGITRRDQGDSQVVERGADTLWFEYEVYGELKEPKAQPSVLLSRGKELPHERDSCE